MRRFAPAHPGAPRRAAFPRYPALGSAQPSLVCGLHALFQIRIYTQDLRWIEGIRDGMASCLLEHILGDVG